MATSNFHNVNATKIFAVEIEEDYDYDDLKENLLCELESKDYNSRGNDPHELRSFPSVVLKAKEEGKDICGVYVSVTCSAIIRSGYYSGVNLDWGIVFQVGRTEYEEIPDESDIIDTIIYETDYKKGIATLQAGNILRYMENTKDELVKELEAIYSDYSEKLVVVARFSNGETIYEKAS
jgi:hypothetical protein